MVTCIIVCCVVWTAFHIDIGRGIFHTVKLLGGSFGTSVLYTLSLTMNVGSFHGPFKMARIFHTNEISVHSIMEKRYIVYLYWKGGKKEFKKKIFIIIFLFLFIYFRDDAALLTVCMHFFFLAFYLNTHKSFARKSCYTKYTHTYIHLYTYIPNYTIVISWHSFLRLAHKVAIIAKMVYFRRSWLILSRCSSFLKIAFWRCTQASSESMWPK